MVNKRGQNLTLGTIILIILGIAVLVFLIFGFTTGWGNLFDRFKNFAGTSNVDTIKQACELACVGENKAQFCTDVRSVNWGDGNETTGTCKEFSEEVSFNNSKKVEITKDAFVEPCPSLC